MNNTRQYFQDKILPKEQEWIKRRREKALVADHYGKDETVGLALSGGGIRSATFNLGILQALHRYDVLKYIDYLSTVSGGGYIGSCLTWLKIKGDDKFPFGTKRSDYSKEGGRVLAWLRRNSQYLTPGAGLNIWALIGATLLGIVVNLLIVVPMFLLFFFILTRDIFKFKSQSLAATFLSVSDGFFLLFVISILCFALFLLLGLCFSMSSKCRDLCKEKGERQMRVYMGIFLMAGFGLLIVGTIPVVYQYVILGDWVKTTLTTLSFSGVISLIIALRNQKKEDEPRGGNAFLMALGLSLLVYAFFQWCYHINHIHIEAGITPILWLIPPCILSGMLAYFSNINHVSMHRFYRNRLRDAYMPYDVSVKSESTEPFPPYPGTSREAPESFYLKDIQDADTSSPYHLINTNLQTIGSDLPILRRRGGENFLYSPYFCGSEHTRWVKTEEFVGGTTNLATAMAVSGAAVDPNTFATRSRPLSFLMTLLNVRLGYWTRNPADMRRWSLPLTSPAWYYYILKEMFGKGLDENCYQIHLSDGGHFENLGVYELIRRRCSLIIASDAGSDVKYDCTDLAKIIEMARVDFGAKISLSVQPIRPHDDGLSEKPFVVGTLKYSDGSTGTFIYIKTTLIDNLTEEIYSYRRKNKTFPDESTADQFFSEQQFEAYRELGFLIGSMLFSESEHTDSSISDLLARLNYKREDT